MYNSSSKCLKAYYALKNDCISIQKQSYCPNNFARENSNLLKSVFHKNQSIKNLLYTVINLGK